MHGPAGRPHRDFRAPYCSLRRWPANTPPNLPRPPAPAPPLPAPGERSCHARCSAFRQSMKRKSRKERSQSSQTATMSRQPLHTAAATKCRRAGTHGREQARIPTIAKSSGCGKVASLGPPLPPR
jgi:hypothetical protein